MRKMAEWMTVRANTTPAETATMATAKIHQRISVVTRCRPLRCRPRSGAYRRAP